MSSDAKVEGHVQQRHHTPGGHTVYLLGVLAYNNQPQPNSHNAHYSHVILRHEMSTTIQQHRFWNDLTKQHIRHFVTLQDDVLPAPMSAIHDSLRNSILINLSPTKTLNRFIIILTPEELIMNIDLPEISPIPVMNKLAWSAIIGIICILILFLLLTTLSYLQGKRRENLGRLPEDLKHSVQSELIEAVYDASQQKNTRVKLSAFWKSKDYTTSQRYVILKDLLDRQLFFKAYDLDRISRFLQFLAWDVFKYPPTWVYLSEQQWQKLSSGASIINGDVQIVNNPTGNMQIAGRGATQTQMNTGMNSQDIFKLIDALRLDSQSLESDPRWSKEVEEAQSQADHLESDANAGRWKQAQQTAKKALEFAANLTTVFANTAQFLS